MKDLLEISNTTHSLEQGSVQIGRVSILKRLWGGFLLVLGYLLSPLSWWNDLFFNLPVAYAFGYVVSIFAPHLFFPAAIAGYWFSNVAGILLMQLGIGDVLQNEPKERNLKKELLTGVVSSTVYTLIIVVLIHFNILQAPDLPLDGQSFNFSALLPIKFGG
ncbi:MAG TPA: hypothetical protein V6C78_21855 [Crinalium sp.]|jgi:hypothetical protein